MELILKNDPDYQQKLNALYHRPDCPPEIAETVAKIVADVKENGNHAIEQYLKNIDGVTLSADQFAVTEEE